MFASPQRRILAQAVLLAALVPTSSAQTWDLAPSTSVTLPTLAYVDCDCPTPAGACLNTGPTLAVPGFLGNDRAWVSEAFCDIGLTAQCGCSSRGIALVRLDGLGTGTVTIRWDALAWADHGCTRGDQHSGPCNCPSDYETGASATIGMSIDLVATGLPPGTPVTVDYGWKQISASMYEPEAAAEDTSSVAGGSLSVGGGAPLFAGTFDLVNVKGILGGSGTGSLGTTAGSVVTVDSLVSLDVEIVDPPKGSLNPCLEYDSESTAWGGEIVLSLVGPPPPLDDCPAAPQLEFSLDLASAAELSDPGADANDRFDPGDTYLAGGGLLPLGGADGVRDDAAILPGIDLVPDAPDGPPAVTAAPACSGLPPASVTPGFFDLDGTDALDFSLVGMIPPASPLAAPIPRFDTPCVHEATFLVLSYDDDGAGHYVGVNPATGLCEIPTMSASPTGAIHGSSAVSDEILGALLVPTLAGASAATYPIARESAVHASLGPNPPPASLFPFTPDDDDVDALDVNAGCGVWLFSVDHEATMASLLGPMDPGGVYEVTPGGPVQVVDEAIHLGISGDADLDAIEFVFVPDAAAGGDVLALLFSVSDDDPLTPLDESGGLDPAMIYVSGLTGTSSPLLSAPLADDIDALAAWCEPLLSGPTRRKVRTSSPPAAK